MSLDVPGRNSKCTEISSLFSAGSAAYAKLVLRQAAVFLTLGREREALGSRRLTENRFALIPLSTREDRLPGMTRPNSGRFCPRGDAEHRAWRRDPLI
jgi:hypothetical protein